MEEKSHVDYADEVKPQGILPSQEKTKH